MQENIYKDSDVFATLTYGRNQSRRDTWIRTTNDSNRFIQRVQRKVGNLEYLRVLESHKDGYPHIHLHLRFRSGNRLRQNGKFIINHKFNQLKRQWTHGLTDFQCPRERTSSINFPLGYVLKYIGKSTSTNTLWSRILNPTFKPTPPSDNNSYPLRPSKGQNIWHYVTMPENQTLLYSTFKLKRIKLLSYSRNYPNTFNLNKTK